MPSQYKKIANQSMRTIVYNNKQWLFSFFGSRLEKKVYTSGESAVLHVDVKNNSNVDIDAFIIKVAK